MFHFDNLCFMKRPDYHLKKPKPDEGFTNLVNLEQQKNNILKSFLQILLVADAFEGHSKLFCCYAKTCMFKILVHGGFPLDMHDAIFVMQFKRKK